MTFLSELYQCAFNPIGMHSKEVCILYWENRQIQRTKTDLLNLWLNN